MKRDFKYIDTHSHLHFPEFDGVREEVMEKMREEGMVTIAVGTGLETSKGAVAAATAHPNVIVGATIGVHPTDFEEDFNASDYEPLLECGRVVAVGEFGFDYFRTPREEVFARQKVLFEKQLDFALEHDLPLMLHIRPSEGSDDAHLDALAILEPAKEKYGDKLRGNCHFFTGSLEMAKRYWAMGFTTAFPGVVTFAESVAAVAKEAPLDKIIGETDAPYAAPKPYRGKQCEPWMVKEVYKKIAELKEEDEEKVREQMVENARRLFQI